MRLQLTDACIHVSRKKKYTDNCYIVFDHSFAYVISINQSSKFYLVSLQDPSSEALMAQDKQRSGIQYLVKVRLFGRCCTVEGSLFHVYRPTLDKEWFCVVTMGRRA